ncbi:microtubule-actin cross-linking factor 1 isoform X24 [Orussus abietinus]|uniref:microtubule-actin cross-linking factor 1 isoform X24 n=1 Tax=Orussus abietinus TaxID=222816 RepID=UPI0006255FA0|nr:microtubule-actin cross-linking factor 1 isoform X24 [Orussus abietinus]
MTAKGGKMVRQRALREQRPLRTFRTEFNIYESSSSEERYTSVTTHYTQSQYTSERHESSEETTRVSNSEVVNSLESSPLKRPLGLEGCTPDGPGGGGGGGMRFSEIRSLKRVHRAEEGIGTDNVIEARGILHPETGESLTVGEAIGLRVLDVRNGRIATVGPDGKSGSVGIEEATRLGLIERALAERLLGPCGVTEEGRRVSLLEAIQRELQEAERGDDRVKVTYAASGVGVADATRPGLIDPETGLFVVANGERIAVEEAHSRGYLVRLDARVEIRRGALALADAVAQGLVDDKLGRVLDRDTGEHLPLDQAVARGIVDANVREVVDARNDLKVTVAEALRAGILNPKTGRYVHGLSLEKLALAEARRRRLIAKPLSLKDCRDLGLLDDQGRISSPARGERLSIQEALDRGVLDAEGTRSVVDAESGEAYTLAEALARGLVLPDGRFRDTRESRGITIQEAVDRGLVLSFAQRSIFDVDGFKDPVSGEFVSLNAALLKGLVSPKDGGCFVVDPKTGKTVTLDDAVQEGHARPEVLDSLRRGIGVMDQGREISALEAVLLGLLDPRSGQLLDPRTRRTVPLEEAIKRGLVTPDGAALLASLLNVTVTTQTVTRTVKKVVTVTETGETVTRDYAVSYEEARKRGLIDEEKEQFRHPETGQILDIREAIQEGLLGDPETSRGSSGGTRTSPSRKPTYETTFTTNIGDARDSTSPRAVGTTTTVVTREVVPPPSPTKYVSVSVTPSPVSGSDGNVIPASSTSVSSTDWSSAREESLSPSKPRSPSRTISSASTSRSASTSPVKRDDRAGSSSQKSSPERSSSKEGSEEGFSRSTFKSYRDETTEFVRSSTERKVFELPTDGWTLAEAIERKLFDPVTGLFIIPGTDRLVSFEECVKLQIIDPVSGLVIDPNNGRKVSLLRSLEKGILDSTGHYVQPTKISMKVALEKELIILQHRAPEVDATNQRLLQITKVSGMPDKVSVSNVRDSSKYTEIRSADESNTLDPVQVTRGVIYDPATALVIFTETGGSANLLAAVHEGTLQPEAVIVKDPASGKDLGLIEAVNRGILDPNTGDYVDQSGRKISLADAAKFGVVAVLGAPLVAAAAAVEAVKRAMVEDPKTGEKIPREVAINRGLVPPDKITKSEIAATTMNDQDQVAAATEETGEKTMVEDPRAGEKIPREVVVNRGLVAPDQITKTEMVAARIDDEDQVTDATVETVKKVMVEDPRNGKKILREIAKGLVPLDKVITKTKEVITRFNVLDPTTGEEISAEEAVSRGIISPETIQELSASPEVKVIPEEGGTSTRDVVDQVEVSLAEKTRSRVTTEPKFKVTIGRARSLSRSPEREAKPIVLQKMRKRVVKPRDAVENGMIDPVTADILEKKIVDERGEPITLVEAVESGRIHPEEGRVVDPQRGDVLDIGEALRRGVLDRDSGNLLVPLARSLSVPGLYRQGLLDPQEGKVVHPETGVHLTLNEAITCEVVDPLSKVAITEDDEITLESAIASDVVDGERSLLKRPDGPVTLVQGVERKMFAEVRPEDSSEIPPAGMTFPVALKRGLVDPKEGKVRHPITGELFALENAIDDGFIMSLPYPAAPDNIEVTKAVESGLLDADKGVLVHPTTGVLVPVDEAVLSGLLVVGNSKKEGTVTAVTETVTSYHTITTKTVQLQPGYVLLSATEVQDVASGEVIPVEEARSRGLLKDESETKEEFTTRDIKVAFSDAVEKGLVDITAGTYTDPDTGTVMPIARAVQVGILDTSSGTKDQRDVPNSPERTSDQNSLTVLEAVERIYDEETGKFKDPVTEKSYDLEEAIEVGLIESDSMVYDVKTSERVTTKEAVQRGILDPKTGKVKDDKGASMSIADAAKLGLLAVVAAPVLAGKAVVDALKSKEPQEKRATPAPIKDIGSGKEVRSPGKTTPRIPLEEKDVSVLKEYPEEREVISIPEDLTPSMMTTTKTIDKERKEPKPCQILLNDEELPQAEQSAAEDANEIDALETEVFDEESGMCEVGSIFKVKISKDLTAEVLAELGAFDLEAEKFVDPYSGEIVPFNDFVLALEILDLEDVLVKDPSSKTERYVTLRQAIHKPLLDRNLGYMVDPKTGKKVPFFEAIQLGWIQQREPELEERPALTLQEAVETGICNPASGALKDPGTGDELTLMQALNSGLIDADSVGIRNPANDEIVPLLEAVEAGIVDEKRGVIINVETRTEVDLKVAFLKGLVLPGLRKPISLEAAINKGLYHEESGLIEDGLTKQRVDVEEGVRRGILDAFITECQDSRAGAFVSLDDALTMKLLNPMTGRIRDTKTGELLPLQVALHRGLIITTPFVPTLIDVIVQEYYSPRSGLVLNPMSGDELTVKEALAIGYVDGRSIKVKDDRHDLVVSLEDAEESGLMDLEGGLLTSPHPMTLDVAFEKGYILSTVKPWTVQEALAHQSYDPVTKNFVIDGQKLSLEEAITKGYISVNSPSVKDPRTGDIISLGEAIKLGLIDPKNGTALDSGTGLPLTLTDALDRGLVVPAKRKISLPEAVFKGFYDPKTGHFVSPETREKLPTDRAIRKGVIDPTSAIVRDPKGDVITFNRAIERFIVNPKSGRITNEKGQAVDFHEAFERGLLLETRRPMSLSEAIFKKVYAEETGTFLDPQSGSHLTVLQAIERNLIDAESVMVKDTRTVVWEKITLIEAIRTGYVDGTTGRIKDPTTSNAEMSLREAYEAGLIVDNKAAVSLQRAIHQGLYDDRSGKITDPGTGRAVTLHEAMRKCIISPTLACYWDKRANRLLSLAETCRAGVIDRRSGMFKEAGANCTVPLSAALQLGLIVDIESASFGLYEALAMELYDVATGRFVHPSSQKKLTLAEACQKDLVNPLTSIVKDMKTNRYIPLPEATMLGIVDEIRGTYKILDTDQVVSLQEARKRGLVVPSSRPLSIEEAVRCGLYRGDSGKFADPVSNEFRDIAQALSSGLLDPETTALKDATTGQIKSLLQGIEDGTVDVPRGRVLDPKSKRTYNMDVALERGLLVTLEKTLTQRPDRAVTSDTLKTTPKNRCIRECTLEEAIGYELLDPETAVLKDRNTGKWVTLGTALKEGLDPLKRGTLEPRTGKGDSRVVRFGDTSVFYEQPPAFETAVEKGLLVLETGRFTHPDTGEVFTLKEAVTLGLVDPDSALIKDLQKKKLVKLPEAFRKGMMDAEKGSVLDTMTSKLYSLPRAVESGLLSTQKQGLGFIEALQFGLYNPTTGGFRDPFVETSVLERKRLTLGEAVEAGLIDPSSTVIKDPMTGAITGLLEAVSMGRVDPVAGRLMQDPEGNGLDFLKALERGYVLAAEARQAVEEKYKLCDETLTKLLQWISEVEDTLASQDVVKEDIEDLRNQINSLKQVKEDLESHSRPVSSCLDQVRQVVLTGSDVLSSDEVSTLEKNGRSLKSRFDRATDRTDKLLKRMTGARDELTKFKNEIASFSSWLDKARRILEDKERSLSDLHKLTSSADSTRDFISDVIAHQADLRFITMAAQKFVDEGKEYLQILNDFRTSLPQRLPHKEPLASQDSPVRSEVTIVTARYKDLLSRANSLSDRLSGVGGRQRDYQDSLEKARNWLKEVEPKVHRIIGEPVAAEPKQVEEQLGKAKTLNNEFLANERLIDNAKSSVVALLRALDGQLTPIEANNLEEPVKELEDKYRQLSNALADKCQELDTALVQSQGVQDALDGLVNWLNNAETQFKNLQRPASLQKERLEEQQRDQRVLQADLDSHRASVEAISTSAHDLLLNSSNARVAKRIEGKLKDVQSRFEKLLDKSLRRGEFLDEISQALGEFLAQTSKFDSWYAHMVEALESRETSKLDVSEYETRMAQLSDKREDQRGNFEDLVRNGKGLVSKKDITDAAPIRDKIKALESQWKELGNLLEEKQRLSRSRAEQLSAYEKLKDQVVDWLTRTESKVQRLQPVAVDLEKLKKQVEELKPVHKEYRDYGVTVDKVNDLGMAYDSLLKERGESPTRRRGSTSPTKRSSITSPLRRMSQDGRSPSPTKTYAVQSPVSPGGSSGFSSRRSSQDGFHLEELSPVQQQLSEINNRYSLLGVRLADRQTELDNVKEELRKHLDNLKTLSQFLDKVQRQLPKEIIPATKEEADKTAKQIKLVIEELYEKQSLLDSTRTQVRDLVRRKKDAEGVDRLNDELEDVASRWKSISDRCKDRIKFLEDIKEFHDTYEGLHSWLGAKERMLGALGPISSDPRMVASQVQQVQVLREEFRTQQPQLDHLVQVGENVLARVSVESPDGQKISAKLSNVLQRWSDQLARLDERAQSLGDAVDTSREFDASLNRLRDALQGISDNLDELPLDKDPEEQLRKIENLERQLEGQRPLLADAEAAGAQLCEVLSDPASRSEIQGKLATVGKLYNNLQKKLDHRKAEVEGNLRDGRQFEASCSKTLGWLADELGNMSEKLLISADREVLQQQLDHHEPVYRNVMGKEHEVIMLLNKGRDILGRPQKTENRALQRDLDKMQSQWDRLKKDTVDRHTRLQTCAEHCKKYYRAQDLFLPWLRQAEDKLESLKPASFKRKDIEKQLKELSSFRNEVWKRSGEFENNKTLGETFVGACDIDKEVVKNELAAMRTRWDKLNNDLLERTQSLEDTARHLTDFNENLRDVQHGLQRCEDKLASHDALGGASKDPKLLDRIKNLREETLSLKKPLLAVRQQANDLMHKAGEQGVDASHLQDEVDNITDRIEDLQAKLDDRCSELQSAATAVAQFTDLVKNLSHDLLTVEKELDSMKAPGRDIKTVRGQIEDIGKVIGKINRLSDEVADVVGSGERLVDSGFAPDAVATRDQVDNLKRLLGKLDERARNRDDELSDTLNKLQEFYHAHGDVMDDIAEASDQVKKFKPVGSEVDSIRVQQEDFRALKTNKIEPIGRAVDDCNLLGQALVQTAGRDVNTGNIEKDLDKMNEKWNDLKDRLNERDRKLDVGLLQSGKFQEALEGLEKWLADTEEMVANQKPPSSDYKVVKAQLQEQKFLKKMLLDRQNSMSSLFNMGQEVAGGADPKERKYIEKRLKDLMGRFDNLTDGAAERMDALERAMNVAKTFQDKLVPLAIWLDKTEKKVKDMELVPTDEEKIQQRVSEHDVLHDDILSKKPDFSELTEIASYLMSLVGEDEAATLADKLQDAADRYATLVERSEALGSLLQRSRQSLRHLVLTYQDLQAWMDGMELRLSKYRILAVHTEKLLQQMEDLADLTEEVSSRQIEVDSTTDSGLELMKHISSDEALRLKDKLDSLQRHFNDLVTRGSDLLKHAQEALPLVQQFHDNHNRLMDWMQGAESALQSAEPREEEIIRLEMEISEYRLVLDKINTVGPQLCQISPGEGAATIEGLVTRDNRRFDAIAEQIQRKAERIQLSKQRSLEVIGDIDDLLDWFREVDNQLREAEPPSSEPEIIRVQLKEHKALNDDISSQKGRVRDVISTAKKVIRENAQHEDTSTIRDKMEDLRETMEIVSALSSDRLGALEQALPLAEHLRDTHLGLVGWLEEAEHQIAMLPMPALRPDLIAAQQDKNEYLVQSINEHKPLVEKLNKTGEALIKLCNEEEGVKVQDVLDNDNARYAALRAELRGRQQALEQALQESSQFSDKLEGMLRALSSTADQVHGAEPVSAHPPRLRDQMEENAALADDLAQRSEAYAAVRKAADDVISKAGNRADPAVKDIKRKLEKLNKLWTEVQKATSDRGLTLDDTLAIAERFWSELNGVMSTLRELQDALAGQAPPAAQPAAIQQQQVALHEIRQEIDQTKPDVEQVRASGHELMGLCGEPDKPEVRKHIEDLDQAWDNVTALYARREENLIDAMEKAMEFHETLQNLLEFLEEAEDRFAAMGPLGSDIDEVKRQIKQLANFKTEVDPHMVKVEALNRQAAELTERTSSEQAAAIKEPLGAVNRRWDGLLRGVVERQRLLENALLRLGQFQHALDELLVWIDKTDRTLDDLRPVAGDPQVIEVELAKLKVLVNDIQAHQTSVDTLNDAGRQLIEDGKGTAEASTTAEKLGTLNRRWRDLLQRAADRQRELEDALREAQSFTAEIQDLLSWLGDVDNTIVASKPVGGLPETASEQLERFMEVYNELEQNRPKVETVLQQGQEYLKRAGTSSAGGLNHNLRTLKQRWDNVTARASDKKIKLEIALREATEFHDALQAFVDWLTNAEKILTNLKPVSRVMETILGQIEEHKAFQKDVGVHRETMLNLDKKGTHLKYFSQKQDVILIKNLLVSVQHRWERVVSKSAERTRALDHGYKEAREFHDAWSNLMTWLEETERTLDEVSADGVGGNDPEKIKSRLNRHREIQKALGAKQGAYDNTMKSGKILYDKAPKSDEAALKELLNELKNKWTTVCGKCVDRQRKLEEALLFSGQFKDAIQALLDWLSKTEKQLSNTGPLHGDLDTVTNLVEQHRSFEGDLESRASQMESVIKTGRELESKADPEDASTIRAQLRELNSLWDKVTRLSSNKSTRLEEALREAERLHKAVHVLLEWLSDAEMKLRFAGQLPEDEQESRNQLMEHEKFLRELKTKEVEKDNTLELAHTILAKSHPDGAAVIKHWITIIQSRWEEVSTWAHQRNQRLENHMQGLQDLDNLLEELLAWLEGLENTLNALEAEPLPDDRPTLEMLISDHREFMENTSRRQNEVDRVCKARQIKPIKDGRKISKPKTPTTTSKDQSQDYDHDHQPLRKQSFKGSRDLSQPSRHGSRASPGRERTPDPTLPHIGPRFPPKGSKGAEPEFRSPRVRLLWDRWRHVWFLAWERQRRLQDKYNYIQELDRVANFSWEDWRKRFLKFMNHKKSRLTDLFRKMDKNNDGLIPREDFIQGIMNTKFETSRLEMGAVADLFDRQGEGLIDWKEFIAALRPDWEERRTYNDTDKIHDEVKRLVMLCTCRQKFRVFQVGEGKYRFGDSQKLRLVRILRSTVMVRVGGGWVALDEFLLKNDPCRAKGRTNIELREQFILADGVSQTMTAFRSKPSPTSTLQRSTMSSAGPITKVRERSARSVPMGQSRASRSSLSAGTPDSLSDNESSFRLSSRKTSTPYRSTLTPGGSRPSSRPASRPASRPTSRPSSRPASRQGSKPASRYGSTQSLDSTDESGTPSRIPRRTVGTSGNTPTSSRHNSVSGRRLGAPVNGSSSRPRTPTGLVSPASGAPSRLSSIHRASSIPTLSGVGTPISRSRIPVYVGADIKSPQSTTSNFSTHSTQSNHSTISTDSTGSSSVRTSSATNIPSAVKQAARKATPSSGTSTPLPPSTKLSRKPSGASDTSVSTTPVSRKGKPTPIDQRAPFRL